MRTHAGPQPLELCIHMFNLYVGNADHAGNARADKLSHMSCFVAPDIGGLLGIGRVSDAGNAGADKMSHMSSSVSSDVGALFSLGHVSQAGSRRTDKL